MQTYFIKITVSILFCGLLTIVQGQGVKLGLLLEPGAAWLKPDRAEIQKGRAKMGFNVGLMSDFYFAENYAFGSGIFLLFTGGSLKYQNEIVLKTNGDAQGNVAANSKVQYRIQYLRIPLGLKLRTHQIGRFRYYADLGVDALMRIGANAGYVAQSGTSYENIGVERTIRMFAAGYHIGGGLKYSLGGNAALVGGIGYMKIFTDMTSHKEDRITGNNLLLRMGVVF
ncbi:MAG: PorT family protein [Bacteroidales bacterium]|jgi:hypothetical protein|nr:PorT family protein [Bacteroidales bacterium]